LNFTKKSSELFCTPNIINDANTVEENAFETWHKRLGHIKEKNEEKLVIRIRSCNFDKCFCKDCMFENNTGYLLKIRVKEKEKVKSVIQFRQIFANPCQKHQRISLFFTFKG